MESLIGSMAGCLKEGKLPIVPATRRLDQCLFPARLHPRCAALHKELMGEWRKTYGAKDIERIILNDSAGVAAYFWPNSTDDKRTKTLLKYIHWIFLVDDALDELNGLQADQLCNRLIEEAFCACPPAGKMSGLDLSGGRHAEASQLVHEKEPLIMAVTLEMWNEMKSSSTSPTQSARFAAGFTDHLLEQVRFTHFRDKLVQCSQDNMYTEGLLEEFNHMRRVSSAFALCVSMVEYDMGPELELDEGTVKNPLLQELYDAVCDHGCWTNDILSFAKEYADGDVLVNLLFVLHMRNNQGKQVSAFETAVSQAWQMIHAREEDCARLAHQLLAGLPLAAQPGLKTYVETVCGVASGNWTWMLQSPRYARTKSSMSCTASLNNYRASSRELPLCRAPHLIPSWSTRPRPLLHLPIKANKLGRMALTPRLAARVPASSSLTKMPCPAILP